MLREGFRRLLTAAANTFALGARRSFRASTCMGQLDVFVSNSLISSYAKCGRLKGSVSAFEKLEGEIRFLGML